MVDVVVEPLSTRFAAGDERWLSQVSDLAIDLDRLTGALTRRETAVPGSKGAITDLVVSLGSAGAYTAVIEVVKAWLGRDGSRRLKLTWSEGGNFQSLELAGQGIEDVDLASLQQLVRLGDEVR